MRFLRNLIQNANVLNVLLVIVILAFAAGIVISAIQMRRLYTIPRIKEKAPAAAEQPAQVAAKMPSDYAVIGEQNLFHPERTIPVDKKVEVPRPEVVLYGTMMGTDRFALIEDKKNPVTTPGRGNRQRFVRKGEVISGYTVTDIMSDRITLARGDDRMTVMLADPGKQRTGDAGALPGEPAGTARPATPARPGVAPARPPQVPAVPRPPATPGQSSLRVGETVRPGQPASPQTGGQAPGK
jgi:type II secretory pathway component PulC